MISKKPTRPKKKGELISLRFFHSFQATISPISKMQLKKMLRDEIGEMVAWKL
jgi:hypothetical protein